jgi:hypothetical protein
MNTFGDDIQKGQAAFVTGSATGIGKEIARTLGAQGARVATDTNLGIIITCRSPANRFTQSIALPNAA